MEKVICRETFGSRSSPVSVTYLRKSNGSIEAFRGTSSRALKSFVQTLRTIFLPQGYPDSVSKDYLTYQLWDTLQAFCSSITGTLATQAMLKGVGVGDVTATAAAATVTWLLKDGTGMCGRIIFAWYQGSSLDCDAKRWRLFADILNDAAICVELVSPAFPSCFTLIACFAGLLKSIVGVAGGATRAALTMHQARRNNMADVSAKDGSQETLVNLAALLVGLILTPVVAGNHLLTWFLFFLFTFLHLYANYRAVTCVVMETLNQSRFHAITQSFFRTLNKYKRQSLFQTLKRSLHWTLDKDILSPAAANAEEPVLWKLQRPFRVNLGVQFGRLASSCSEIERCFRSNHSTKYLIGFNRKTESIDIVLHCDCTTRDIMEACFQAELIQYAQESLLTDQSKLLPTDEPNWCNEIQQWMSAGHHMTPIHCKKVVKLSGLVGEILFPRFLRGLECTSWVKGHELLGADEWRAEWSTESRAKWRPEDNSEFYRKLVKY